MDRKKKNDKAMKNHREKGYKRILQLESVSAYADSGSWRAAEFKLAEKQYKKPLESLIPPKEGQGKSSI